MRTESQYYVIFDGDCGVCQKTIDKFRKLTFRTSMKFVPSQEVKHIRELDKLRFISEDLDFSKYMYLFENQSSKIEKGFHAFRRIFLLSRYLWIVGIFGYLPGVSLIGRFAYSYFASNRIKFSGPEATCGL